MSLLSTVWDWKVEPESPPGLFDDMDPASEDVWLFDDHDVVKQVDVVIEDDDDEDEKKLDQPTTTRAEVAAKLLDDLDEWIKEEPFNDWLEEKMDLPIFEDLPPLESPRSKYKSLDTQALLQEFEHVFMELNNGALTPPQSPPLISTYQQETEMPVFHQLSGPEKKLAACYSQSSEMLTSPEDIPQKMTYSIGSDGELVLLQTLSVPKAYQQPDLSMETTSVLDELLRSRAADIDTWDVSSSSCSSASPPRSESDFVLSPPESGSDSSNLEVCEDPEWVPVSVSLKAPTAAKRKRGKPYARPVEDKKLRKKEQNKNAATRYRQKKKQEVDVIVGEEKGLLDRNTELHKNVDELSREIKYLKGLMRDLFKAKGLLK